MKTIFPYEKVLNYKERQQDLAQQEFGVARLRQTEIDQKLQELVTAEDGIFQQYNQVHLKTVSEILEIQADIDHMAQKKRLLEHQSVQIHQEVETKQQALADISKETKMWNKWKEQSVAVFQKQLGQKEQAWLDDLAVTRFSRKA